jgi:type IV secretory pathway VirB4 component
LSDKATKLNQKRLKVILAVYLFLKNLKLVKIKKPTQFLEEALNYLDILEIIA